VALTIETPGAAAPSDGKRRHSDRDEIYDRVQS